MIFENVTRIPLCCGSGQIYMSREHRPDRRYAADMYMHVRLKTRSAFIISKSLMTGKFSAELSLRAL